MEQTHPDLWFGIGAHLRRKGHQSVTIFDVVASSKEQFDALGDLVATSATDAQNIERSRFLVSLVADAEQTNSALFPHHGEGNGAAHALPHGAVILMCSTLSAADVHGVQQQLLSIGRPDIGLIDCPLVSRYNSSTKEASLTILASGSTHAIEDANGILSYLADNVLIIPGGIGSASNVNMINNFLVGTQTAAAAEAMGLAARAGLDTREVYEIITNAAGNSRAFEDMVPAMLEDDWKPLSTLDVLIKDMGTVTSTARAHSFPVPLAAATEQLYLAGASAGYGKDQGSGIVRVYLPRTLSAVHEAATASRSVDLTPTGTPLEVNRIGFVGLGAMGYGMATSLVRAGISVHGYDVYQPSIERFISVGDKATAATSPYDAAEGASVLVLMVQNASQVEDVLFGSGNAATALPHGAVVILHSTVPPSFVRSLEQRLLGIGKNIGLVDAPVSGGVARAAKGDLTIICSGSRSTISSTIAILNAMSGAPRNLCHIQGGVGAASSVKLINQLLAGVHIATAAEAMAFASKLGLNTQTVFDTVKTATGYSWMLENRVPAMLTADWTPNSALAIFVKDLGIVLEEARRLGYPAPLSAAAHQLYLFGASNGWANDADSGIVRVWESMTGVSVVKSSNDSAKETLFQPRDYGTLPVDSVLDSLPPISQEPLISQIQAHVDQAHAPVLVVLDDDPTGTQTVHDIAVLTVWDQETLSAEFRTDPKGFFILTNSRALPGPEAKQLIAEILHNVAASAKDCDKSFDIVLRGDSTLRGHLPEEPDAAEEALGAFDGWVIAPFFLQGGRYTLDDVHYVREGDLLVPASKTPFAEDATFGYKSSNLRDYVREKCGPSRFREDQFMSISIEDTRGGGPEKVAQKLLGAAKGTVVIVNAAAEEDMAIFALGLLLAEKQGGKRFLYRTGAAFVSARLGIQAIDPLTTQGLGISNKERSIGGLIVAGSYVPKTTAQLQHLRERRGDKLNTIELDVERLISSKETADTVVADAVRIASGCIQAGEDVLVMTSRKLITGDDPTSSLKMGGIVAEALVQLIKNIEVRPRYIIAKGGITSSDAASKGLGMKRAMVLGQAAKGVPLWRCDESTSRHTGIPFVVFPGNVGSNEALGELVERWAS